MSKFARIMPSVLRSQVRLLSPKQFPKQIRLYASLIPPSQYDQPFPKKFHPVYFTTVYWETIPLTIVVFFALSVLAYSIFWACNNKVDVQWGGYGSNISRTMDLRHPTCHKIVTINERNEPWPEMQDVLDKMMKAEQRRKCELEHK